MQECAKFFARPRTCPRSGSFNVTPCQVPTRGKPGNKRNLLSYSALERNRVVLLEVFTGVRAQHLTYEFQVLCVT
ncbi:hypothetical protein A2U01_0022633 [Trifolium medium]|uniref:Uncharacterized protein n=1 Tax=Trifolium medium TaxID=97028 RepID=A0A392NRB2_9FABA|nr:hypothetical protein [Trifolium medium]